MKRLLIAHFLNFFAVKIASTAISFFLFARTGGLRVPTFVIACSAIVSAVASWVSPKLSSRAEPLSVLRIIAVLNAAIFFAMAGSTHPQWGDVLYIVLALSQAVIGGFRKPIWLTYFSSASSSIAPVLRGLIEAAVELCSLGLLWAFTKTPSIQGRVIVASSLVCGVSVLFSILFMGEGNAKNSEIANESNDGSTVSEEVKGAIQLLVIIAIVSVLLNRTFMLTAGHLATVVGQKGAEEAFYRFRLLGSSATVLALLGAALRKIELSPKTVLGLCVIDNLLQVAWVLMHNSASIVVYSLTWPLSQLVDSGVEAGIQRVESARRARLFSFWTALQSGAVGFYAAVAWVAGPSFPIRGVCRT